MVAEPARDQVPECDGQVNTLERFEEDVLIFTHAVPKNRKVTLGPKLLSGSSVNESCAQDTEQKHGKHGSGAPLSSFPLLLVVVLARP